MSDEVDDFVEPLTVAEAVERLRAIRRNCQGDCETCHIDADMILLRVINDDDVTSAFSAITRWYS